MPSWAGRSCSPFFRSRPSFWGYSLRVRQLGKDYTMGWVFIALCVVIGIIGALFIKTYSQPEAVLKTAEA